MSNEDVRFLYLRDDNSNRVLTIARRLSNDRKSVEFAFAVNHPTKKDEYGILFKGDQFNKSLGRRIALGRLNSGNSTVVNFRDEDERPIEAVIGYLAFEAKDNKKIPQIVRKIAHEAYLNAAHVETAMISKLEELDTYHESC